MYRHGEGVEQNIDMTLFWLNKAAEQGDVNAQYLLGSYYRDGENEGVANLEVMYSEGIGIDYDLLPVSMRCITFLSIASPAICSLSARAH